MREQPVQLDAARPGDLIGYTKRGEPIRLIGGAAEILVTDDTGPDDDDVLDSSDGGPDDDDDDDDELEDEPEDAPPPRRQPKPQATETDKLVGRLRAARAESKKRREWLLANGIDPHTGQRIPGDKPDQDAPAGDTGPVEGSNGNDPKPLNLTRRDVDQAAARATARASAEAELTYMPALVEYAARSALAEAGWAGKNIGLALRLLDPNDVDFDPKTRELTGLEEQIMSIKEEFPDWFKPQGRQSQPRTRRGAAEIDGGKRRSTRTDEQPRGWAEEIEARWLAGQ
jgi:hypothetical protein